MKILNTILIASAISAFTLFSACTKEYTCQCTIRFSGTPGMPDSLATEYPITDTKKKAKSACEAKSTSFQKDDVKTVETCELL